VAPGRVGGMADAVVSNTTVRKDVWVRLPHPARVGASLHDLAMVHVRPQAVVDSALRASDDGMPDAENAAHHGVAVKTIRRWRREYQRRGRPRGQAHCAVSCPRCDGAVLDTTAYAELLGWYLGDGYISRSRRGVFSLHVYNDLRYPKDIEAVLRLMERVKPGGRPHVRHVPGCAVMTVGWNHWPCLFPQHGPGRKHDRRIVLEAWQLALVEQHPEHLLRGLFHSDGSRSNNWATRTVAGHKKKYDYPRWEFANRSQDIIQLCCWALDLVGVAYRLRRPDRVAVSRRADVAVLDGLIGPKQ
jgi:hypothetical protein